MLRRGSVRPSLPAPPPFVAPVLSFVARRKRTGPRPRTVQATARSPMIAQSSPIRARSAGHESADPGVPGRRCRDGECGVPGAAAARPSRLKRGGAARGLLWIAGGFLFCPCHLPLTIAVSGAVLGGTAAGAALREHPLAAGGLITVVWLLATWRGLRLLRTADEQQS
jgi:mercuric ion transport protein